MMGRRLRGRTHIEGTIPIEGLGEMIEISHTETDLVDEGLADDQDGQSGSRGSLVTITTIVGLLLATALTLLGVGAANNAVANFDASSWLFSSDRGEVDRVNGVTAKVDTRAHVKDTQNHQIQVSQTDRFLILRDLTTGQVSTMDLTTLQVTAVMDTAPGIGVTVALRGETAFIVDTVQGQVRQLDPRTLAPTGDALTFPPGLTTGTFDDKGTLWIAVPSEGTVVAIAAGNNGASPTVVRTIPVTAPDHDLDLSVLDDGVAVLDNTVATVTLVKGTKVKATSVPLTKPGALPARTSSGPVPVTVADDRQVIVVDAAKVHTFAVPGTGELEPAVAFAGHFYCAEPSSNTVYEFDAAGVLVNQIHIPSAGGSLELDVREGYLFINAPDGSSARVVDQHHKVSAVDKFDNGVLGGDPPPQQQPPAQPKPVITVPGRPQSVVATPGNGTVRISWKKARDNGAPVTQYVIEGSGQKITVGAKQRTVVVTGLVNGTRYTFTIHAVNARGAGPNAMTKPVSPSSAVPDPPLSVTATENPDGSITVKWPAANGQGHKIKIYTVTAITGGAASQSWPSATTTFNVPAGALIFGTQVAFNVITINDLGNGSNPSPLSNTVVPFGKPGAPVNLSAATAADKKGTIRVAWQPAPNNGRPILKYVIDTGGPTPVEVTSTSATLSGFGDDQAVQVQVTAVNLAGSGPPATATARTIGLPTITWTSDASDYRTIRATFTPNNKGGTATCKLTVTGVGSVQAGCTTQPITLSVSGAWPNNTYSYAISISTAAGSASVSKSKATATLRFTVICPNNVGGYCNSGIWAYTVPSQQNINNAIDPSLAIGSTAIPQCHIAGGAVNATPWGGKNSSTWLRLSYHGQTAYFPWAWARLDGGDKISNIPAC
jgi:fibronectin type III domain protein